MVYRQGERERPMVRSKPPLHNFPMDLKWGNRIVLRCMNVNSNGEAIPALAGDRESAVERRLSGRRVEPEFERGGSSDRVKVSPSPAVRVEAGSSVGRLRIGNDGIEALRKEIMSDLHSKADKMKDLLREGLEIEKEKGKIPPSPAKSPAKSPDPLTETDYGATMPWKLRTRRAACKEPMIGVNGGGVGGGNGDGGRSSNVDVSRKPNNLSSLRNESTSPNSGGHAAGEAPSGQKRERAKFSCSLSHSEIEQDFLAMTGHRLPRRPKKRPRAVQKILENLSPAMWLTEVHPDHYKVPDAPENGKR